MKFEKQLQGLLNNLFRVIREAINEFMAKSKIPEIVSVLKNEIINKQRIEV